MLATATPVPVQPAPAPRAKDELLVRTPYSNTMGVYKELAEPFEGCPAYQRDGGRPHLYKLYGQHWVVGDCAAGGPIR